MMTPEEALFKTKQQFTNLIDGNILPGYSVGEIISYYESLIAGDKPSSSNRDCNITKQFTEDEIEEMDRDLLREGFLEFKKRLNGL